MSSLMGQVFFMIQDTTTKWIKVDHEADLKQGMKNKEYFGAIVIEKDFSEHAMSHTQSVVGNFKKQEMEAKVK